MVGDDMSGATFRTLDENGAVLVSRAADELSNSSVAVVHRAGERDTQLGSAHKAKVCRLSRWAAPGGVRWRKRP